MPGPHAEKPTTYRLPLSRSLNEETVPEYFAPGVFIEEISRGPRPIEGVPTSTAAILGETERGSAHPYLITNFNDYLRYFGGHLGDDNFMPYALRGFFENGGRRAYVCRIAGAGAISASRTVGGLAIEAVGPGVWGNRVFVKLTEGTARSGPDNVPLGFRLQIAYWSKFTPDNQYLDPFVSSQAAPSPPSIIEQFDDLVWNDPSSPDYFLKRLEGSALVKLSYVETDQASALPLGVFGALTGGTAGAAVTVEDYRGANSGTISGLAALELDVFREVALVAAPAAPNDVVDAIRLHCEQNRFRFAVIDTAKGQPAAALNPRASWASSYAAFYYPWIYTDDLQSGTRRLVPPSGHVLGLYARTDYERGVWKAPANEVLRGALDLEYHVDAEMQDILNPRGINAIRQFSTRGIRVWGARTLSANSLWKYVSIRRLFIFLERSIYDGTQWVVFEPNDQQLWERVKDTIRTFLRTQWRNGALMGATEEQAFFITCDRSTMSDDDIASGLLIYEIGIAPVRPAEFMIIRIVQLTADSQN